MFVVDFRVSKVIYDEVVVLGLRRIFGFGSFFNFTFSSCLGIVEVVICFLKDFCLFVGVIFFGFVVNIRIILLLNNNYIIIILYDFILVLFFLLCVWF